MARALLAFAALMLAVPGLFIVAKGVATLRRGAVYVQGRWEPGRRAVIAAVGLLAYGALMILGGWLLFRGSGLLG
jgi:hypothetical protein